MKEWRVLFVLLFLMPAWFSTQGQVKIKGHLTDSSSRQPLGGASLALLKSSDSVLIQSAFTDKEGAFQLGDIREGKYILNFTYLGYQPVMYTLTIVGSEKMIDVDTILLQRTGLTLNTIEIIETRPSPMVVKKDTLEFNAGYFKTRENAFVEELLKKLPGIQVDRDGTIRVNGEQVKTLLVDGKPFFGSDPKMATRNLTADMIDKVQLIDRKSDWAQFTGINDGETSKTINITIKNDRKKGYFGRVGAGYGSGDHFAVNGNLNQFSEAQQLSVRATGTNINGYQDDGVKGRMSMGGNGDLRNWNGGGNFSRDFGSKLRAGASYFINSNSTQSRSKSERQNLLPDTTWYYNQNAYSRDNNNSHGVNAWMELKPDSMHVLNISTNFSYSKSNNLQENQYATLGDKQELINNGNTTITNTITTPNFSTNIFFAKRFKKAGRNLGINLSLGYNNNKQQGFNKSLNFFTQPGGGASADTIDQLNDIGSLHHLATLAISYTEPVSRKSFLEFNYTYSTDRTSSDKYTYDYSVSKSAYDQLNDSLSNLFKNLTTLQQAGIHFRNQQTKFDYGIGFNMQFSDLQNNNISRQSRLEQHTINLSPSATFNYRITRYKSFRFNYSGSTQPPGIAALQPVPDNSNPLNIQMGNPDLKPAFNSNFNLGYNAFSPAALRTLSVNLSGGFITNKIINASWYDSLGRQVRQPVNVNGAYNLSVNVANSFPLKEKQTTINTNTSGFLLRDVNYINGTKGYTGNLSITQNLSFNYAYKELFDLATVASINYNMMQYSIQKESNTQYFNYNFSFDYNIYLPFGFTAGGNLDYVLGTGRAAGYNSSIAILNAFVSKSLFRYKQGLLRMQGFDLLNRNVGIYRNVAENYIEDVQTTVVQRIFLVSFSYFLKNQRQK